MKKLFFFLFILTASVSYAMSNAFMFPMNKWWELPSISSKLNLNEQEKEMLHKLLVEKRSRLIELEAALKKERFKIKDMLESKSLDENSIKKEFDSFLKTKTELLKTRFEYVLGIRKILGLKRFEILKEVIGTAKFKGIKKHKPLGHHRHHARWAK